MYFKNGYEEPYNLDDLSDRVFRIFGMWLQYDLRGHLMYERARNIRTLRRQLAIGDENESTSDEEICGAVGNDSHSQLSSASFGSEIEAPKFQAALQELFDVYVFAGKYESPKLREDLMLELHQLYEEDDNSGIPNITYLERASKELSVSSLMARFFFFSYAMHGSLEADNADERTALSSMSQAFLIEWLIVAQKVSSVRAEMVEDASELYDPWEALISPCQWLHEHGQDKEAEDKCRADMLEEKMEELTRTTD